MYNPPTINSLSRQGLIRRGSAFLMCLFLALTSLYAQTQMVLNPSATTVNPGDNFSVVVQIQSGTNTFNTGEVHLDFDPSVIEVDNVTPGTALGSIAENEYSNTTGTIDFAAGVLGQGASISGNIDLVTVNFTAVAVGSNTFVFGSVFPRETQVVEGGFNILSGTTGTTITVTNPNTAPFFTNSIPNQTSTEGDVISGVDADADDAETPGSLTYSASGLPPGLNINASTGEITGTISAGASSVSSYSVSVSVTDGDLSASSDLTFDWTVNAAAPVSTSPVITLQSSATVDENGSLSVPLSITDLDGDNLTVTITTDSDEPENLQSNNSGIQVDPFPTTADGFFSESAISNSAGAYSSSLDFSPTFGDGGGANGDGSGSYTITVQVEDEDGNTVTETLALTVNDIPQPISATGITQIEAESFDNQGGTGGSSSGIGVEINPPANGNPAFTNIGFTNNGDFAEYEIDVAAAGTYQFVFFVAKGSSGTSVMTINGGPAQLSLTGNTGWGNYFLDTVQVDLLAGPQTLRFDWSTGGGFFFNIDYFTVEFVGAGAPEITVAPLSIDFGTSLVSNAAGANTVTISNDGVADLTVSNISLNNNGDNEFSLSNLPTLPATVTAGNSVSFDVDFTPGNTGLEAASIDIVSDDADEGTTTVALTGEGVAGDITPPVITLSDPGPYVLPLGVAYVDTGATANDNVDGDITQNLVINTSGVDENTIGSYTVTYDVSDAAGNAATQVSRTVNVIPGPDACTDPIYRVNVGGPEVAATDGGIPWGKDQGAIGNANNSPYLHSNSTGNSLFNGNSGSAHSGSILPTLVSDLIEAPLSVWNTERFDVGSAPEQSWKFPIAPGTEVQVTILLAELFGNVDAAGERVFDIEIEGSIPAGFDDIDKFATAGPKGAFALSTTVTVVGDTLDIVVLHDVIENPALKGIEICQVSAPANTDPTVSIDAPTDGANITRGNVTFQGTANDTEDGNISPNIVWNTSDIFSAGGTGASLIDLLITPGPATITAEITDSNGATATTSINVNVSAPDVEITSPLDGDVLTSKNVKLEWNPTDVLSTELTEHFHIYINPADTNNINTDARISTADSLGQNFRTLPADSIKDGENVVVIRIANQFHDEFTYPGTLDSFIQDIIVFDVNVPDNTPPVIVLAGSNPLDLTLGDAYVEPGATATDSVDGDISGNISIDASAIDVNTIGSYPVTYNVSDAAGNAATEVVRTVNVNAVPTTDVFFTIEPPITTVDEDDTFTVTVEVQANAQQIDLAEVYLSFDPTVLEVQSVTPLSTTVLPSVLVAADFDNTAGSVQYGAGNFSTFPSGSFDHLQIEFKAIGGPSTTIDFFDPAGVPSTNATFGGVNVLTGTLGATINVNENPELTFTPATFNESVLLGGLASNNFTIGTTDGGAVPGDLALSAIDDNTQSAPAWLTINAEGNGYDIDATGLAVGTYNATLTATGTGYDEGTATVELVVSPLPELVFTPDNFLDTLEIDGTGGQSFTISTSDQGALPGDLAVSATDDATGLAPTWLTPSLTGYTLDATGLGAGDYTATLTASGSGYTSDIATVSLNILDPSRPCARVAIDPSGNSLLTGSTFNNGFIIENNSEGSLQVTSVSINLSTAIFPNNVFDPVGDAGDASAKCLIIVNQTGGDGSVGLTIPGNGGGGTDPDCTTPFSNPVVTNGFTTMTLDFTDFDPSESVNFAVDVDPLSILGFSGAGNAGAVSGFELIGSTVTVTFSDGSSHTGELYRIQPGSNDGSENFFYPGSECAAPGLTILGTTPSSTVAGFNDAIITGFSQTAQISGNPGENVSLLVVESTIEDLGPGIVPGDFEANKAQVIEEFDAVIGSNGTVDIALNLADNASGEIYTVVAVKNRVDDGFCGVGTCNTSDVWRLKVGEPEALVEITPGGNLGASTFGGSSFQITNNGDVDITSITFDLSTGILPDMVFDPVGAGGDATSNCLTPNSGAAATGFVAPADPCVDPFSAPRQGGFDVMTIDFTDFNNGESFFFTTDIDPNSIQGVQGAGNAGAVSGYELVGATITMTFADGSTVVSSLYEDGSLGGAQAVVAPGAIAAPTIAVAGVASTPATVFDPNQTITVVGNPGDNVSLLNMDSRLFIASGDPPFNVTDPTYYANEAMSGKALYTGVIPAGGSLDIPVTLLKTVPGNATPEGGLNQFIAVTSAGPYAVDQQVSQTSNVITLLLEETAELNLSVSRQAVSDQSGDYTVKLYQSGSLIYDLVGTADAAGNMTLVDIEPGNYDVAVKYPNCLQKIENLTLAVGANAATVGPLLTGDINDDNAVNIFDFQELVIPFSLSTGATGFNPLADLDGNGTINIFDFQELVINFGVLGENP